MKNSLNIKRRRPFAKSAAATALTATAAALSLSGCNMAQQAGPSPKEMEAERRVAQYQADLEKSLEKSLDPVDRERLRASAAAAAATRPATPTSPALANAGPSTAPAHAPAVATTLPAQAPGSASVILASSTPGAPTTAAPAAVASAVTPAVTPSATPATPTATPATQAAPLATPTPPAATATPAGTPDTTPTVSSAAASSSTPSALPTSMPPMSGVVVAPLSGDNTPVSASIIAPFTPPITPVASAMGSMTAMLTAAQTPTAEVPAAATPEESVDQAIDVLRKNIAEHPTLNTALALALLNNDKAGVDAIKKLPDADQKVAADLLAALDAMKNKGTAPTLAARTAPILDAAKSWQADADLVLPRLVLATRVDSFGVFTPTASTFSQGQRHTVIIYCEVANFTSKKADDGWYTTKLAQQETLFTEDGLLVWRPNAEDVEDRSLNQRHDFYLVKKLTIPETLASGKYTLRMSVTDLNANKLKIVEMPIEIVNK